jgi:hypothetical protein
VKESVDESIKKEVRRSSEKEDVASDEESIYGYD